MTVFVVEVGEYSQRGVVAVCATPEAGMAHYPHGPWTEEKAYSGLRRWFTNEGDSASVEEYEVEGS